MIALRALLLLMLGAAPGSAIADPATAIPGDAAWYLHVDLEELRTASSGKELYGWLDAEVFQEIRDDLGIDLNREADSVTAFSDSLLGTVIVVEGAVSEDTRDKLMALAAADAGLDRRMHGNRAYFHADRSEAARIDSHSSLDELQKSAFFSFDVENRLIVTSNEKQMEAMLDNDGRITGNRSPSGALFVLTADSKFMQAGARTDQLGRGSGNGWDSNILRHTEQVDLLLADRDGRIAFEAKLVARESGMARSLAGIMNGLISLQMLDQEMEPSLLNLLQNTRIEVNDAVLSINTVLDRAMIAAIFES